MENSIRSTLTGEDKVNLTVCGEIDFSNADEVAQAIRDVITDSSPPALHVDLHDATFIDSTGLGALIEGYRAATEAGTEFVVVNPRESFRRVLSVTGLSNFFGLEPSEATGSTAEATGT